MAGLRRGWPRLHRILFVQDFLILADQNNKYMPKPIKIALNPDALRAGLRKDLYRTFTRRSGEEGKSIELVCWPAREQTRPGWVKYLVKQDVPKEMRDDPSVKELPILGELSVPEDEGAPAPSKPAGKAANAPADEDDIY